MQITGVTQHHVSHPLGETLHPTWTKAMDFAANLHEMGAADAAWCEFRDRPGLGVELDRSVLEV